MSELTSNVTSQVNSNKPLSGQTQKRAGGRGLLMGLQNHFRLWLVLAGFFVVISVALIAYSSHLSKRDQGGKNALFLARTTLDEEMKALQPAPEKQPKDAAPPPTSSVGKLGDQFEIKLKKSLESLRKIASDFKGSRAGFEANILLGRLTYKHGESVQSIPYFESAIGQAPKNLDLSGAYLLLGQAREQSGKIDEALDAYEKGFNLGEPIFKGEFLLAKARIFEAKNQLTEAKETYDKIIKDLSESTTARTAEALRARIP